MSYNEQASQGCCVKLVLEHSLVILQMLWCDSNSLSQLNTTYFSRVTNANKHTEKTKKMETITFWYA